MATITEPGDPGPEPLRATELKNRPCIIKPAMRGKAEGRDGSDWHFVEAEVWLLDRSGVERHEAGVRISWKRALPQLEGKFGQYVVCRPKETETGGVVLVGLDGEARVVAERVVDELLHPDGQHPLPAA
jgi:hypothetical protein